MIWKCITEPWPSTMKHPAAKSSNHSKYGNRLALAMIAHRCYVEDISVNW